MEDTNQNKLAKLFQKIVNWWKNLWSNPKEVFYFLFIILTIVLAVMVIGTTVQGGFLHFNTDDIIQYYPFMGGFIDRLKNGQLSLYDTTLFGGTSFFAGVYYLPFDLFTLLTLLLSFIMNAETAYGLTNFLRPMAGALILYYVLIRKGMKTKTSFIVSIIYFVGGMTQAYFVFPVYLGIICYAPLAMLLVDVCLEKKGWWYLLIPLYTVVVILYDYYLAYMLLAFLVIYFLASMHIKNDYSFFKKNSFIINKEFWKRFGEMLGLVLLGVGMASFMLIPSIQYVLTESSRNSSQYNQSFWYFVAYNSEQKKDVLSLRHYFTIWCNFFIPNEPHRFMLVEAGDYVKEHVSFYLTSGGFIYLVYFFFSRGSKNQRLKFWVILLNVLFLMPIFSMIFTANAQPYVRWFFIPYMFNIYAMATAMDKDEFAVGKRKHAQLIPLFTVLAGFVTLLYVVIKDPKIFIHYSKSDILFYPILVISLVILGAYLILLLINYLLKLRNNNFPLFKKVVPWLLCLESILACALILGNIDNTSSHYYNNKKLLTEMKSNLYSYGYRDNSGYRININDNSTKGTANVNTMIGNINFGRFFQSFYNTPLNQCLGEIFREPSTSWSRTFNGGYNLLSSNLFNVKYVVSYSGETIDFPNYYTFLGNKGNYNYYELKDMPSFIVYDSAFSTIKRSNLVIREEAVLNSAYVKKTKYTNIEDIDPIEQAADYASYKLYEKYEKTGIDILNETEIASKLKGNQMLQSRMCESNEVVNGNDYFVYDLANLGIFDNDVLEIFPLHSSVRNIAYEDVFIRDTEGNDHGMHYTTCFLSDSWTPSKLYIRTTNLLWRQSVDIMTYSFEAYENFIEYQNQYTNRSFLLDGDEMYIKCTMPEEDKVRLIKTPYTYSDDWFVDNESFETINVNGGFLGIVIPKNVKDVNLIVKFRPKGFVTGCKIALVSSIIYIGIITPVVVVKIRKRKEKDEKNNDHSTLL